MKRILTGVFVFGASAFLLIQFIRPGIPQKAAEAEVRVPTQVKAVLQKDCYSCHSDERRLSWFDELEPAYWLVRKDVLDARAHLNFSTIGSEPEARQKAVLFEAVAMMQLGAMPLPRFSRLHPEAKVTVEDLGTLKEYLSPWTSPIPQASTGGPDSAAIAPPGIHAVSPSPNELPYDGSWRGWKLLAVTDRGDIRQFRLVFGNDIAAAAAQEGKVNPWPDGARLAKAAWLQEQTPDGLVVPGKFWQIEFMVKGAEKYRATDGWGWGRWRGTELKPYGKDATFVNECTGCHLPVRGNDSVYTQPFSQAGAPGEEVLNGAAVTFPKDLPFNPLDWKPITVSVDPQALMIAVLLAPQPQATGAPSSAAAPADSQEMALVTWTERDDPHWFGARIADKVQSVEWIRGGPGKAAEYRRFGEGTAAPSTILSPADRLRFIACLRPVQVP